MVENAVVSILETTDEYEKFRPIQDEAFRSDFDAFVEESKKLTF